MGYALWLVPSSTEFTALSEFMKFRPQPHRLDPKSRSYPLFDPHITLATFEVLPPTFSLDTIPLGNLNIPVVAFDSVKCGNNYLGALSIRISQSRRLTRLHEAITDHLSKQNVEWKSRSFPHMSLFYVDEAEERKRLEAQLRSSGRIQSLEGDGRKYVVLTANPTSAHPMQATTFTGVGVWLVDCTSHLVKEWRVMEKRSLVSTAPQSHPKKAVPEKSTERPSQPKKRSAQHEASAIHRHHRASASPHKLQGIVASVVLPKPLAPVRDTHEANLKSYQPRDLPIWTAENMIPAIFAIGTPLDLTVHVFLFDCPRQPLTLHVSYIPSSPSPADLQLRGSSAFELLDVSEGDTTSVAFNISLMFLDEALQTIQAPWGISGVLKWEIETSPDGARVLIGETPIELYALNRIIFKAFASAGIPRAYLQRAVLPTLAHGVKTEADWINWAVKRFFASPILDDAIDEQGDVVMSGSTGYTHRETYSLPAYFGSIYGSGFDLDGWLSHRESAGPLGVMNCYNQTGLMITTLSLGIPYNLIRWQLIRRTNNDAGQQKISNHSFATVEIDGEDRVVDACIGPIAATVNLSDYIERFAALAGAPRVVLRHPPTLQDLAKNDADKLYGLPLSNDFPVSADAHDQWSARGWAFKFCKFVTGNNIDVPDDIQQRSALDLSKVFGLLTQEVVKHFPLTAPENSEISNRLTDARPLPGQTHIALGPGGAQVQWTSNGVRAMIRILPSPEVAKKVLRALPLLSCSFHDHHTSTPPSDVQGKGARHDSDVINNSFETWCSNNFVVEVFRFRERLGKLKVKFVADRIRSLMQVGGLATSLIQALGLSTPSIVERPNSVKPYEDFDVKVKAIGATYVTANFEGEATLILKNKVDEGADVCKFTFVAAKVGNAKIVFTAFKQETCQITSAVLAFKGQSG